ncbi:protease I [Sphingobacterium nematocida]|uniref:Protease I n=1 Tax=Sphingobacterium nematocida TaxID=1513896 RepID=A0A1T5ATD3_9SPHI|nr:type 1 glutamine amidotransferase domain-containing protein [Sphingobacterium nematocida]SKB37843.1 protease I [Sphingobacterium nematocida]
MAQLTDKKIAILVADGFEEVELTSPQEALVQAGAKVEIVSLKPGSVRAKEGSEWTNDYKVDVPIESASVDAYDGLVLPGGVINPDTLRTNEQALAFVKSFFSSHKPVAAICHGPQVLINAEVVKGRKMTSVEAIKLDLINAGAQWEDAEVIVDQGLVSSRTPKDLPAFNRKMIEEFAEGKHKGQHA